MMVTMFPGTNSFQMQLLSLCWDSIILTALLTCTVTVFHQTASHLKLCQILTISWSSIMWMWEIQECITVAHGIALLLLLYHSDSQNDKNLFTAHSHFCFNVAGKNWSTIHYFNFNFTFFTLDLSLLMENIHIQINHHRHREQTQSKSFKNV